MYLAWRGARLERIDAALLEALPPAPPAAAPNAGDPPRADPLRRSLTRAAGSQRSAGRGARRRRPYPVCVRLAVGTGIRPSFASSAGREGYMVAHLPTRVAKVADTLALIWGRYGEMWT